MHVLLPNVLAVFTDTAPPQPARFAPAINDNAVMERLPAGSYDEAIIFPAGPGECCSPMQDQGFWFEFFKTGANITRPVEAKAAFSHSDVDQEILKCGRSHDTVFLGKPARCCVCGYGDESGLCGIYAWRKRNHGIAQTDDRFLIGCPSGVSKDGKCKDQN